MPSYYRDICSACKAEDFVDSKLHRCVQCRNLKEVIVDPEFAIAAKDAEVGGTYWTPKGFEVLVKSKDSDGRVLAACVTLGGEVYTFYPDHTLSTVRVALTEDAQRAVTRRLSVAVQAAAEANPVEEAAEPTNEPEKAPPPKPKSTSIPLPKLPLPQLLAKREEKRALEGSDLPLLFYILDRLQEGRWALETIIQGACSVYRDREPAKLASTVKTYVSDLKQHWGYIGETKVMKLKEVGS